MTSVRTACFMACCLALRWTHEDYNASNVIAAFEFAIAVYWGAGVVMPTRMFGVRSI